jgi:signal transduction histidine kinase/CheY-like chemotaxis protein
VVAPAQTGLLPVSRLLAGVAILVGLLVCLGWAFDVPGLRDIIPNFPEMKLNTAITFVLGGVSLWLVTNARPIGVPAAQALGLVVAVIGIITLGEYAFGWQTGLDQLLVTDRGADTPFPGRISLTAAVDFTFLGLAFALIDFKRNRHWPSQWLAALVAAIAFVAILGYAYDITSPFRARVSGPVALHSAILFLLLAVGIAFARPDRGIVGRMLAGDASGLLIRRLLPASLLVPPVVGWIRLQGELAGLYDTNIGLAIFVTANIVIFSTLIWHTAEVVRRADERRSRAETRLHAQLARLDLLNHITHAIGERQDPRSIFQVVVRSLEDHLKIDFCCIGLYDPSTESLTIESVGVRSRDLANELSMPEIERIAIGRNGLSRAIQGVLVYEKDISELQFPFPQRLARVGLKAVVIAPLLTESIVAGVLIACRRTPDSFSSTDCEFLRQLSEHVALANYQSQLYSALKQAYDDLRQSQQTVLQQERLRALGQMSSGLAHDINNALTPASLYAEALLEGGDVLSAEGRRQMGIIRRALDDIGHTVSRMKEFAAQRETQLQLQGVNLTECVRQVLELTRVRWRDVPQAEGIAVDLKLDLAAKLPNVMAVESEVRDGLTNLIFNALDAMPQGGTLKVRTFATEHPSRADASKTEAFICVEVTDTGVGMDEDTRRRCMEPFFTTKGERGTGLGLAMVYGMAKRHGGELEIESEPGEGTTIRLVFPSAPEKPEGLSQGGAADGPIQRLRILIVDDDPILLQAVYETLKRDGHLVTIAEGGQAGIDAFELAQKQGAPFDAVITDLGMPYVDGRRVAAAVRAMAPSVRIILLTGWGQRLLGANDIPPHVDEVLAKPPKLRELRAALAAVTPRDDGSV